MASLTTERRRSPLPSRHGGPHRIRDEGAAVLVDPQRPAERWRGALGAVEAFADAAAHADGCGGGAAVEVEPVGVHLSVRRISGPPTPEGVRTNIAVALRYFDAWLRGQGAVALHGLMEDAATAEIARVQIWQWLRHRVIDRDTVLRLLDEEVAALGAAYPWAAVDDVRDLFERTALAQELPLFFTPDAYSRHLVRRAEVRS